MEVKTKEVNVYVTADGEEFYEKGMAESHEKMLERKARFDKFKIENAPKRVPSDANCLMPKNYIWYKASNEEELKEILMFFNGECTYYKDLIESYPEYVGVANTGTVHTLTELKNGWEFIKEKWGTFFEDFAKAVEE